MQEIEIENKIDNSIVDIDEMDINDTKINPEVYIHYSLLKAQQALVNPNVQEGLLQYRIIIEHIEGLCLSANIILNEEEYLKNVKEKKDELDKQNLELSPMERNTKIANIKFQLLTKQIFKNKVLNVSLKAN